MHVELFCRNNLTEFFFLFKFECVTHDTMRKISHACIWIVIFVIGSVRAHAIIGLPERSLKKNKCLARRALYTCAKWCSHYSLFCTQRLTRLLMYFYYRKEILFSVGHVRKLVCFLILTNAPLYDCFDGNKFQSIRLIIWMLLRNTYYHTDEHLRGVSLWLKWDFLSM